MKNLNQPDELLLLNKIAQIIYDKKGFNILALDVRRISSVTDYVLIAEGAIQRHVISLARAIQEELQKQGQQPLYSEGMQEGDWIVIDYSFIVIHLFMPGLRDKYQLEQLWHEGEIVDLDFALCQA